MVSLIFLQCYMCGGFQVGLNVGEGVGVKVCA